MRAALWSLMKKVLFSLDAESVHKASLAAIRAGISMGGWSLRLASGAKATPENPPVRVLGMDFRSRLGLAAGFDKDAEILEGLPHLGFGFAEIGTVTPRPQPGNPLPRLFRDPARQAIFNRMGFNGLGATIAAERLAKSREKLPENFRVGINVGKNKDTPLENAAADYVLATQAFRGLADYVVINVSSPNTPGLRSLQSVEALTPIISDVKNEISGWPQPVPLLLKLAPEVSGEELRTLMERIEPVGISGWVLTNTVSGTIENHGKELQGGWSGGPLTGESRQRLRDARAATRLPIISVGGILSPEEARARIEAGADLIQIYSGWIYGGPSFPVRVSRALLQK